MKYSIKKQIALIFIVVMTGTIMLCWIINSSFLENYYIKNKKTDIKTAYNNINRAVSSGDINSYEFDLEFQKICDLYNMNVLVIDAQSNMVKSSTRGTEMLIKHLYDNYFNPKNSMKYLEENEKFNIAVLMDLMTDTEYLEMWGVLDNGNLFLIRSPLESIRDSVKVSNRFLMYVGTISTLISAVIIWVVTTRITKPIMELKRISEKMTELDFDTKYVSEGKNELDLLGEHMNKMSETLEKVFSELKTANNELKRDIEKKEQIDEMRKEFLANVSHELKTPIALIQGYAEGLLEGINDDAESREFYCEVIMDEANKMNNMVKKLLDLNQLEFGNDVISMERFDITELIRNYVQSAEILITQNNIKVQIEGSTPVYVWADEYKTEEVFSNFFSNAMNHVKNEKIIEIKFRYIDKNKVRISVFNTGEPIPEESVSHIWDKFYKVDKARTREYGGSGVGLSIVKAIMELMNQNYGVINYTNGVEFWFELDAE